MDEHAVENNDEYVPTDIQLASLNAIIDELTRRYPRSLIVIEGRDKLDTKTSIRYYYPSETTALGLIERTRIYVENQLTIKTKRLEDEEDGS